jgi:hypothetical protein
MALPPYGQPRSSTYENCPSRGFEFQRAVYPSSRNLRTVNGRAWRSRATMTNGTETESGCDRRRYLSRDSRNDEWMERETEIRQDLAQPYPYPATQCLECCAAPEEAVAAGPAYLYPAKPICRLPHTTARCSPYVFVSGNNTPSGPAQVPEALAAQGC